LRSRHGLETTAVNFMGASLGALEGAYISVLDADEGKIGIGQYLLVNPPLDLSYALGRLNEWDELGRTLGKARATALRTRAIGLVGAYSQDKRDDPQIFERAGRDFSRFSREELQYLIAQYVHLVLPELVYVTQAIHEQNVLAAPRTEGRKRLAEAPAVTLKDYQEKVAVPVYQRAET